MRRSSPGIVAAASDGTSDRHHGEVVEKTPFTGDRAALDLTRTLKVHENWRGAEAVM